MADLAGGLGFVGRESEGVEALLPVRAEGCGLLVPKDSERDAGNMDDCGAVFEFLEGLEVAVTSPAEC